MRPAAPPAPTCPRRCTVARHFHEHAAEREREQGPTRLPTPPEALPAYLVLDLPAAGLPPAHHLLDFVVLLVALGLIGCPCAFRATALLMRAARRALVAGLAESINTWRGNRDLLAISSGGSRGEGSTARAMLPGHRERWCRSELHGAPVVGEGAFGRRAVALPAAHSVSRCGPGCSRPRALARGHCATRQSHLSSGEGLGAQQSAAEVAECSNRAPRLVCDSCHRNEI